MNIQIVHRTKLDVLKYDNCIDMSERPMPYALAAHLDIVARNWKVVVLGDYDMVMPIAINRKLLGVPQIYHPFYAQQLGAFGHFQRDKVVVKAMLNALSKFYVRVNMQLNASNPMMDIKGWSFQEKANFEIDLDQPYEKIFKNYRSSQRAGIRKNKPLNTIERGAIGAAEFVHLGAGQKGGVGLACLPELIELYGADSVWTARLQDGQVGALGFFPVLGSSDKNKKRVTYLIGHTTTEGRKQYSAHCLLDAVIEAHAGQGGVFDFEGSELPGVSEFFRGFGPQNVPYIVAKR